jgi:NAD(P)-dependent dehydrogenase (short-subunit alcohol dehydrogenase family)
MKIAITGHAGGLGAAIASAFEERGDTILGFSIPEYDVYDPKAQKLIIQESMDADIFVNCAFKRRPDNGVIYRSLEQTQLFAAMYHHWKNENKHIINISSIAPTYVPSVYDAYATMYRAAKAALDTTSDQAAILNNRCRVTNIRPDWIDSHTTDMFKTEFNMKFDNLLEYEDVAKLICHVIDLSAVMTITSISFKGTIT